MMIDVMMIDLRKYLIRQLGEELQAKTITVAVAHDRNDPRSSDCLEFYFGQVAGIEIGSGAEGHSTFTQFQPEARNQ